MISFTICPNAGSGINRLDLEATARRVPVVTLTMLGDIQARGSGHERFGNEARSRVFVDDGAEWTAVADQTQRLRGSIVAFYFGEPSKASQQACRGLQARPRASLWRWGAVSQPLSDLAQRRRHVVGRRALLQDGQQLAEYRRMGPWKQALRPRGPLVQRGGGSP